MITEYQRVNATIDLDAIRENMEQMKNKLRKGTGMIGVIKTDGYGHGAVPIAKELMDIDFVKGFAVATAEEAFILREAKITKPILILGYTFPYSYERLVKEEVRLAVFRKDTLFELQQVVQELRKENPSIKAKVHVAVDTGMSRIGVRPGEEGLTYIKELLAIEEIELEGIFTHFSKADEEDKSFAYEQLHAFQSFVKLAEEETGYRIPIRHIDNSAGIVELPEGDMDMVRAGITLYGLWPSDQVRRDIIALKPALSLHSSVVYVKEIEPGTPVSYGGTFVADHKMKIATIPVGYGDGYPRSLSNKGYVLIRGQKAQILGRVCMDQFMVDVTEISDIQNGDPVVLIGRDGELEITMEELGTLSGRFNYELACCFSKRIPRAYVREGKVVYTKDYYHDIS